MWEPLWETDAIRIKCSVNICRNEWRPNKWEKQKLFTQSLFYSPGVSHQPLQAVVETQRQVGKRRSGGGKRKVAEPPGLGEIDLRHPCDWLGAHIRLSLIGPTCSQNKNEGSCELLIKSWLSGANSYRSYSLASWSVTKHSNVASCKPDF